MNIKEICRYLGYKNTMPDGEILGQIEETYTELMSLISPKSIFKMYPCEVQEKTVEIQGFSLQSKDLARHLQGCSQLVVLGVTLGVAADTYIRKCSMGSMAKAAIASAACAVVCEEICDERMIEIKKETPYYLTPRFSPGYGDLALSYQRELLILLNAQKTIGLTITDGFMLAPTKSVTALIGFTENAACNTAKCKNCKNSNCEFREEATGEL